MFLRVSCFYSDSESGSVHGSRGPVKDVLERGTDRRRAEPAAIQTTRDSVVSGRTKVAHVSRTPQQQTQVLDLSCLFLMCISHKSLETSNDSDQFSSNALFQED